MKRCPRCNQQYADDLSFCLSDGTPLLAMSDGADEPTVVRPSPRTQTAAPAASGPLVKVLAGGIILLLGLIALGGIAAWLLWPRDVATLPENGNRSNTATPPPPSTQTPRATATRPGAADTEREQNEQERRRLEDERRPLEEDKRDQTEPPTFNDPGATRIAFKRGRVGETVSGTIGRRRSFVLWTMAGQYLSANVRSANGCVTFADGGSSTGFGTRSGDSQLNLRNNCGEPAKFSLSVTVR